MLIKRKEEGRRGRGGGGREREVGESFLSFSKKLKGKGDLYKKGECKAFIQKCQELTCEKANSKGERRRVSMGDMVAAVHQEGPTSVSYADTTSSFSTSVMISDGVLPPSVTRRPPLIAYSISLILRIPLPFTTHN